MTIHKTLTAIAGENPSMNLCLVNANTSDCQRYLLKRAIYAIQGLISLIDFPCA